MLSSPASFSFRGIPSLNQGPAGDMSDLGGLWQHGLPATGWQSDLLAWQQPDDDGLHALPEATGLRNTLYLQDSGEKTVIGARDIYQGGIGDCFMLSPLGLIAKLHPGRIENMIRDNADGTYSVSLYRDASGGAVSFASRRYKEVEVKVDTNFAGNGVNNRATDNVVGDQKEIWAQVIEKAYATMKGGYAAINMGYSTLAMAELTGVKASFVAASRVTETVLLNAIAGGDLVTFDTPAKGGLGYGLVGSHSYMFDGLVGTGQGAAVKLLNPWGFADPALIPVAQLAKVFSSVSFCDL
jgi:hypothetical protein